MPWIPLWFRVLLLLWAVSAALASPGRAGDVPHLSPAGEAGTLYRWQTDRCEDEFLPDAPVRAIRRADGQIVLVAAHRENWALVGPDFGALRPQCQSILRSSQRPSPDGGLLWIEALFTRDGEAVAALLSQSLTREVRARGCDADGRTGRCWTNRIIAAMSRDGARNFLVAGAPGEAVATLGSDYPAGAVGRFGVFTTSNIVGRDGAQFMIASVRSGGAQPSGNCLFRSPDPFRPDAWRAWDGQAFTVDMTRGEGGACAVLSRTGLPTEVRSLSYDSRRGVWLAVYSARLKLPGDEAPVPGFYVSASANLTEWQPPRRIMRAPLRPREDDPDAVMNYPSLLDPQSRSRNFDTLDHDEALVFYTVHHLRNGSGTMNRDLQFTRIRLSDRMGEGPQR